MPDLVSTDHPISEQQQSLLTALLDTLIPASKDGTMPSAADVEFKYYLSTQAAGFIADLTIILGQLDPVFADLSLSERCEELTEFSANEPQAFLEPAESCVRLLLPGKIAYAVRLEL
ncbi:MAG: hypothetical protein Ct9H300mP13_8640 [Gammaproteobacteria bacterium]|nr:MAG: hypothetical protein Ct9H300mP13_8640 [Gammaproteobacteria bacterium]